MPAADPITSVLVALAIILAGAKVGGHVAEHVGQPAVLGELLVGVLLGNLHHAGLGDLRWMLADRGVATLAELGVVLLLFEVGLESTVGDMLRVGGRSFAVAVLGVVTPWALGWWVSAALMPGRSIYIHAFVGAALTATSVGITARVFGDLGCARAPEARIVLGAAVIDDILGLVVLTLMTSLVGAADRGVSPSATDILWVLAKSVVFLIGAVVTGALTSPVLFRLAARLRGRGLLIVTALVFCFTLAFLASRVGLAPIVGAYAAGLLLEDVHALPFAGRGSADLRLLVEPIADFLVPVFFVVMGLRVDLADLARPEILTLGVALTLVAIAGKQACAAGVLGTGLDALSVGIAMIPRGEVGLIFANLGLGLAIHGQHLVDDGTFAAIVLTVMLTTLLTPPALAWSLSRGGTRARAPSPPA